MGDLELSFEPGQIIRVISRNCYKEGYILGEFASQSKSLKVEQTGVFPQTHVAPFANFYHQSGTISRIDPEKDEMIKTVFQARLNLERSLVEKRRLQRIEKRVKNLENSV